MNFLLSDYPGVFGKEHIIYLAICFAIAIASIVIIKLFVKNEKVLKWTIKGIGLLLFISIMLNRVFISKNANNWLRLIPDSFCGFSSFMLSLCIMFGKKDNTFLHWISYSALIGGIITIFYPDFLESQTFWDPRSITGLLHHTISAYVVILMLITKYFNPSIKKWSVYPLGMCVVL